MATRGYFTIVSTEKNDSDPYIGKEDILVEAYHDGYFQDMLNDILNIPFSVGEKIAKGEIKKYFLRFLEQSLENKKTFEEKYNEICNMQSSSGIVDNVWSSIYDLLQLTEPLKYNRITPGVTRYGYPTSFESSFFNLEHIDCDKRIGDKIIISIKKELDEEDVYILNEHIEKFNDSIELEKNKIRFNEKSLTIEFSFGKIMCESILNHLNLN